MTANRDEHLRVSTHPFFGLRLNDAGAFAALTFAYWATAMLGLQTAVVPAAASALWPASGIALAALVVCGLRLWPAIVLGRLLAALTLNSPQPLWADLLIALGTAAGAVAPILIKARIRDFDPQLSNLRSIAWLILAGAGLGGLISATVGGLSLWMSGTPVASLPGAGLTWFLGFAVGVLTFTPLILSWLPAQARRLTPNQWAHLAISQVIVAALAVIALFDLTRIELRAWHLFPFLVWPALAFNVRGASIAILITSAVGIFSVLRGVGPLSELSTESTIRILYAQQFVAMAAITVLTLAAVADERRGTRRLTESEKALREETRALEVLNATGAMLSAELDLDRIVQIVVDAGVALTGAKFGAFFYNETDEQQATFSLFTLSGASRADFEGLGHPRNTPVFAPTFSGEAVVRSNDITRDPRYGQNPPLRGMPARHLPVRSYLAVPVKTRTGEIVGGILFGHPDPGVFTDRSERLVLGVAAQAAIAVDNARLFQGAQRELTERKRAETQQRMLINELNHRVKNTLATVQSLAAQTTRSHHAPAEAREAFIARLVALSRAHDVLTAQSWSGASLRDIVAGAILPFETALTSRFHVEGPTVWLEPQTALAIAMVLHELSTNAVKYGALSTPAGRVAITWRTDDKSEHLSLMWRESGGPPVSSPAHRGFGSRLIQRSLAAELDGSATLSFLPEGLVCELNARLPAQAPPLI